MPKSIVSVLLILLMMFVSHNAYSTQNKVDLYGRETNNSDTQAITANEPSWKQVLRETEYQDLSELKLKLKDPTTCKSITISFFGNATHPGGGRNGLLNERNDGYGFKCNLDQSRNLSLFVYGILNSKYGNTLAGGISQGITLVDLYGVRLSVGIALTTLSYEVHHRHQVLYLVAPFPYSSIEFKLPNEMGYVGFARFSLSKGIYLRSAETYQFNIKKLF